MSMSEDVEQLRAEIFGLKRDFKGFRQSVLVMIGGLAEIVVELRTANQAHDFTERSLLLSTMKMMIDITKAGISDVLEPQEVAPTEEALRKMHALPPLYLPHTTDAEQMEALVRVESVLQQLAEILGPLQADNNE